MYSYRIDNLYNKILEKNFYMHTNTINSCFFFRFLDVDNLVGNMLQYQEENENIIKVLSLVIASRQ